MISGKDKSYDEVKEILQHGFRILSDNNLKCFEGTALVTRKLNRMLRAKIQMFGVEPYFADLNPDLKWTDYKLLLDGKFYGSKFRSFEEWEKKYR
jgi:hypothetical protein